LLSVIDNSLVGETRMRIKQRETTLMTGHIKDR